MFGGIWRWFWWSSGGRLPPPIDSITLDFDFQDESILDFDFQDEATVDFDFTESTLLDF